jgi:pentatricopeptide repeat protein
LADVLIEEILREGDLNGLRYLTKMMIESNLPAQTSTFNLLLKQYASRGDGEHAYDLVMNVMRNQERLQPDEQTWSLLLQVSSLDFDCQRSR